MRPFSERPAVALAIYAHPDDADVAAGGTLAVWAAAGTETHLVVVCDGAKGSHEPRAQGAVVRARRGDEVAAAAAVLGLASVTELGLADGTVTNDESLREQLVARVRATRPGVVLGPDPTAVIFDNVYVNHRDHREVGWAVLDAVAPASAMPLYYPSAGPPHAVADLLLSGTHEPTVALDISGAIDRKVEAVLAHASQVGDRPEEVAEAVRSRARQAGREIGAAYGESFRHVTLAL